MYQCILFDEDCMKIRPLQSVIGRYALIKIIFCTCLIYVNLSNTLLMLLINSKPPKIKR